MRAHELRRRSPRRAVIAFPGGSGAALELISQLTVTEVLRLDPVNARALALAAPPQIQEMLARMGREPLSEPTSDLALEVAE
ncbi:MAG: hypothetical protein ACWGSQ_06845 [Longimicrobiales bacterium]